MKHSAKLGALVLISALLIPLFLFNALLYDKLFYSQEFSRLGVYEKQAEADAIAKEILSFLKGKVNLTTNLLTEEEKSHLSDVKAIFTALRWTMYALAGLLLVVFYFVQKSVKLKEEKRAFLSMYFMATGILLLALLFLLGISLFNFPSAFQEMHSLLFPQGNYEFPADSTLITLFPGQFFADFMRQVVINTALAVGTLVGIGYLLRR